MAVPETRGRFRYVRVHPSYGKNSALIQWSMFREDDVTQGEFWIYRSLDGANWTTNPINTEAVTDVCEYLDTAAGADDLTHQLHYRIYWQGPDQYESDSPIAGVQGVGTLREMGAVRKILNLELKQARNTGNGVRFLLLRPKLRGEPCPNCVDASGTVSQRSLCPVCYGVGFVGGYSIPIETWGSELVAKKVAVKAEDMRNSVSMETAYRMLAYPQLLKNDILCNPRTDDRFYVSGSEVFRVFQGQHPIAQHTAMSLLIRGHPAYQLELPCP